MKLTPGTRLKSAVCDTEAVVVRVPGAGTVECGGTAMIPHGDVKPNDASLNPQFSGGSAIGKRYHDPVSGLEMLCTKAGQGTLSIDGRALELREAKQLPSSD